MRNRSFVTFVIFGVLVSCATYQHKIREAYSHMEAGRSAEAALLLKPQADLENDDQLVYLLEYATALQQARQFKESDQAFIRAAKIADIQDYHSITRVTGSLLLNEGMIQYKGEPFEKVMIHVMLAINAAVSGDSENALVECRVINQMLEKLRKESGLPFEQNPLARYLSAILWEADRNWDFSYLDYADAYRLNPQIPSLKPNIAYVARKAGRTEDLAQLGLAAIDKAAFTARDKSDDGELIFIYQQGQGPIKAPNPEFPRLPLLYSRSSLGKHARVSVGELGAPLATAMTEKVFDLQFTAMRTLNEQYGAMVAKRIGGVVAKKILADRVSQENKGLGAILWIGMNLADQADLRQWATLPEAFHIARIPLPAGKYKVNIEALALGAGPTGENATFEDVVIKARKKTFL
ncbi:MAG: hypothetical protein K2X47_11800, partial [Bdellovibrionales bacterium]|nr:hypothetical protein [Bdellovibrionales bacterium]